MRDWTPPPVQWQVPLQLGIMLTGNYNWFNLHTLALLLPAADADVDPAGSPLGIVGRLLNTPLVAVEKASAAHARSLALLAAGTLLAAALCFFELRVAIDAPRSLWPAAWLQFGGALLTRADAASLVSHISRDTADGLVALATSRLGLAALLLLQLGYGLAHALRPPPGDGCNRVHLPHCMLGSLGRQPSRGHAPPSNCTSF